MTLAIFAFSIAITWGQAVKHTTQAEIYSTLTTDTIPLRKTKSPLNPLARRDSTKKDTLPVRRDTLRKNTDTIPARDTGQLVQRVDTFSLRYSKDTLDAPVNYEAEDSAVLLVKEKLFLLYGKTKTTYKDVTLTAPRVEMNQETNIVTAYNSVDSTGNVLTRAQFSQGSESFQSDTIQYNFKTQKGLTRNTYTKTSDMWVQGELIKKVNATTTFAKHVIMTTCNYDQPHFGFVSNKAKFIQGKVAVTGPTHPEFEGVPIPIYLPFGIYPLNPGRHSGLLPPQFTVNEQFGIGLEGLGYYHVFNDYIDLTVRTNIYSYGGWSANITPQYRKRYKYNGIFNIALQHTKMNFKGDPDYSVANTFNITWSHSMDAKAKPGTSFTASVNAGSTRFNTYVPNNPLRNVSNTQSSSITYSKTWSDNEGRPYNFTLSANQSQNSVGHVVDLILPDMGFSMPSINPFQRKEALNGQKWYEKIAIGYSAVARNSLSFIDTASNTFQHLLDTMRWGIQHRFPVTMALPALGPFIISPSVSYEETWVPNRIRRQWNPTAKKIDTIAVEKGLFTDRQMSFGVGFNTTVYGKVQFKNSKVVAIRHVMRPNFSMNYRPNLSKNKYDIVQTDTSGKYFAQLSQLQNNIFTGYGYGRFGGMSFGIDNNLEMKVKNKKDTTAGATKIVRLIDGFGFTSAYNFLQDSLKLQPFSLYLRSTLFEKINLTANALLDPYERDTTRGVPINRFTWQNGRFNLGRITSGSIALSTQFRSKPRDPKQAPNPMAQQNRTVKDPNFMQDVNMLQDFARRNPAEFVDFNLPWSLDLSFSLNFSKNYDVSVKRFRSTVSSSASFNNSFSLSPKWNITTNGYYDFNTKQLTQFTMSISRDMHCWQMAIQVTPIGLYKYFNITLSPKSSILQDLRVNRTRTFVNF